VESLNTNPDGKIYPILTHARGTDVHGQFTELTRDILRIFDTTLESRACLYYSWLLEKEGKKKESYLVRLEGLAERCPICGKALSENPEERGFYFETSDMTTRGFLHENCFIGMLCESLYGMAGDSKALDAARMIISQKARTTVSVLTPRENNDEAVLDYRQFGKVGEQIFQRDIQLTGFSEGALDTPHGRLYLMLNETLAGYEGRLRSGTWMTVHPVDPSKPEAVLLEENYRAVQKAKELVGTAMAILPPAVNAPVEMQVQL
jgi:hypothetical protein